MNGSLPLVAFGLLGIILSPWIGKAILRKKKWRYNRFPTRLFTLPFTKKKSYARTRIGSVIATFVSGMIFLWGLATFGVPLTISTSIPVSAMFTVFRHSEKSRTKTIQVCGHVRERIAKISINDLISRG